LVMEPESWNFDEDLYGLGLLNAGNVIELTLRIPTNGTLLPLVTVVDQNGNFLVNQDTNVLSGHYRATVPATGDGSSTVALSVITSTIASSSPTVSPTLTRQAMISASATPSPTSGSLTT